MAQQIFDPFTSVLSIDGLNIHSLLEECRTLITEVEQSAMDQEDEDIFQCGKCKTQFTSLQLFLLHKREHSKIQEENIDLSQFLITSENHVIEAGSSCHQESEYNPSNDFNQNSNLDEPIILGENDILFSIDQESSNYLASDSAFNVPIILSTDGFEAFVPLSIAEENEEKTNVSDTNIQIETSERAIIPADNCKSLQNELIEEKKDNNILSPINSNAVPLREESISTNLNLKYKCNYCAKQFAKKFYWQQHERSHTGEKPYQCVVCGRSFAQKSNVKKHMSSHKVWPGTAIHSLPPDAPTDGSIDRSYHCQFCKEIFESYKALKAHLIVSHLKLKVYKCVQYGCGKMFAELSDFLEHTNSHKRSEYRCHICAETFNTLSDLGLHQHTHSIQKQKTSEKYYCCSVCKSSFSNLEALQHHMETTTHDYACPHCGKSFLIERFLRRHLKTHASFSRFSCDDCGKAFKTEQYLANHKLIHSEETPFTCPNCPARFKRKDRLSRHILIHDLSKRLKCPFRNHSGCMSEFSRPDKLKRHLLTHSNIKRLTCTHCSRTFQRSQALKHHELKRHIFKCDTCSLILKTKEQIVSHNCEFGELKKQLTMQIPKKASRTFKPRRPTPKRQSVAKTVLNAPEKDKDKSRDVNINQNVIPEASKMKQSDVLESVKLDRELDLDLCTSNGPSLIFDDFNKIE